MAELEKVMRGLECCQSDDGWIPCALRNCPYRERSDTDCHTRLHRDALELIREQEPRVMTLEEVKQHDNKNNCVWFELPKNIIAAVFVKQYRTTQTGIISPYVNSEPLISHLFYSNTNYGKTWRCWTSRPSEEQRKSVPWETGRDSEKEGEVILG